MWQKGKHIDLCVRSLWVRHAFRVIQAVRRQRSRRNDIGSRDKLFTALSAVFRVLWLYVLSVVIKSTKVRLSPFFQLLLQVSLPCRTIFYGNSVHRSLSECVCPPRSWAASKQPNIPPNISVIVVFCYQNCDTKEVMLNEGVKCR